MTIDVYTIFFATGELRLQVPTMICDVKRKKHIWGLEMHLHLNPLIPVRYP